MVVVRREIRKIPTIPIELCGGKMRKTSKHPQFNSIRRCLPISKANTHHQLPLRSRMCSRCELNLFQQHSTEIEGISFLGSFVFSSSSRLRNRREREKERATQALPRFTGQRFGHIWCLLVPLACLRRLLFLSVV